MLIIIRSFLILYGVIALGTGYLAMTSPYDAAVDPMLDNSHRFIAAIWASMALAFFYCVWNPSEIVLFRFLMISLFIGGVVRAASLINYSPTPAIVAVILLELLPTPLLWWMHNRLLDSGSL
ncbi:MAG: DUF4345 family protein [Bacteroidota bacterium]